MKVKDFIRQLQENLKPNAEIDFLYIDGKGGWEFLFVDNICMNADVDDPKNKNRGGVVFRRESKVI